VTAEDKDRISALLTEVLRILKSDTEAELCSVRWNRILNETARWYNVSVSDVLSVTRDDRLVKARWTAIHYCAKVRNDYRELGLFFRRRSSTIVHALEGVAARAQVDKKFRAELEAIGRVVLLQEGPVDSTNRKP
jgi:chromosomal replication initiation ATPase DnaA